VTGRETSIEFRVRYAETDQMGVVYHAHYLVWCEMGRTEHIRQLGMPYRDMERQGVALAVAEAAIRYLASARYDDVVRVTTRVAAVRSRTVTFDYVIQNAQSAERLATASTKLVSLDRSGRLSALPGEVRGLLERGAAAPA
jgi:acyl-CoA thioester hydrolase